MTDMAFLTLWKQLRDAGAEIVQIDYTNEETILDAVKTVEKSDGHLNLLVNCGGNFSTFQRRRVAKLMDFRCQHKTAPMGRRRNGRPCAGEVQDNGSCM